MTDWYKVGYWEGVRGALSIFAPWVAMGGFFVVVFREVFSPWLIAAWGALALGMVVAWLYGLRVAALAGEEKP
jgi:hypothetical protein